jgi:hypothetical protein
MLRLARRLQLSLRCGLEGSQVFAEPRLAELATDERRLHANTSRHILEYEAVAMRPNHDTQTAAGFVYIVPPSQLG